MWIEIESTPKYTFKGKTVGDGSACMLIIVDNATGELLFAQFVEGQTAEMIQAGW